MPPLRRLERTRERDRPMGSRDAHHSAPSGARQRLGASGERLAASWLEARGYRILDRNWRCPSGELDLVAELADELVIVEVKTDAAVRWARRKRRSRRPSGGI